LIVNRTLVTFFFQKFPAPDKWDLFPFNSMFFSFITGAIIGVRFVVVAISKSGFVAEVANSVFDIFVVMGRTFVEWIMDTH